MLHSMTGFGAASSEDGGFACRVEVRSVNHRHIQVKTRTPGEFSFLDGDIERLARKRLERGAVSIYVNAARNDAVDGATVDVEVAARYRDQLEGLAKQLEIEGRVTLDALIALPGVVGARDNDSGALAAQGKAILKLVDEALAGLKEMRAAEGSALAADLAKNALALAKIVARIEKRMPQVVRAHQKNLQRRLGDLLDGRQAVQPSELSREIALLADRLDLSEEVSRLKSHLAQLDRFLAKGGAIGRKLDFLVQEIFREINTIGSKCSDAKVAHWVVDAKTFAERLREQVQNVE